MATQRILWEWKERVLLLYLKEAALASVTHLWVSEQHMPNKLLRRASRLGRQATLGRGCGSRIWPLWLSVRWER